MKGWQMKIKTLVLLVVTLFVPIGIITLFFIWHNKAANAGRQETFKEILGNYIIDLSKTKLKGSYEKDSGIYKNLSITFYPDSTFKMNMNAPFMHDTAGRWKAGNVNEWCWLLFNNINYGEEEHPGSQFTRPYT